MIILKPTQSQIAFLIAMQEGIEDLMEELERAGERIDLDKIRDRTNLALKVIDRLRGCQVTGVPVPPVKVVCNAYGPLHRNTHFAKYYKEYKDNLLKAAEELVERKKVEACQKVLSEW